MKVAYFINQYPKVSHSFIRREILALEVQVVQLSSNKLRSRGQLDYRYGQACRKAHECAYHSCNAQRKFHSSGHDKLGTILNRNPIGERSAHIGQHKQVGHRVDDIVNGAAHQKPSVTLIERQRAFAVLAKLSCKTADLLTQTIESKLKHLRTRSKMLTVNNGQAFPHHLASNQALGISITDHEIGWNSRTTTMCFTPH
ncbi:hypothetical protein [Aquabacterium sp. A08]|uniref:hypothetical protein n=1 Tax=Aquabacterium sp. A08 TaxID=2718532 RepID=UPI00141DDD24|nr:hypothetical protein [Aquabacterium sp. A08]NIC41041.1 hypothetical protein [Aquabacterium sp. A08]